MDEAYRLKGVTAGDEVAITDGMVVGRNADCGLVLTGGHPSRKHARLTLKSDGVWVEDLGSANGTFVNGEQISEPKRLAPGDVVAFDTNEFEVLAPEEPPTVVRRPVEVPTVARVPPKASPADAPAVAAPKVAAAARPQEVAAAPPRPSPAVAPRSAAPEKVAESKPAAAKPAAEAKPAVEAKPPPRPAAEAKPRVEPPPAPPLPPAAPDKGMRKPGAWALPDHNENTEGTKLFTPAELKAMQAELSTPQVNAPSDAPYLNVLSGASNGKSFKLQSDKPKKQWEIGSEASRDIVLSDAGVSGFHAKIVNEGNRWKLIDQMSANHTYVNDQQANISFLKAGDRIRFGKIECVFLLPSGLAAAGAGRKPWIIGAVAFVVTAVVIAAVMLM